MKNTQFIFLFFFLLQSAFLFAQNEEVFVVNEEAAEIEGGMEVLYKYIGKKLKYPKEARKNDVEGKVFVQFIVNIDGTISDVTILKGIHPVLDAEVIRVIELFNTDKKAPQWIPGTNDGKPVRQKFIFPITFML